MDMKRLRSVAFRVGPVMGRPEAAVIKHLAGCTAAELDQINEAAGKWLPAERAAAVEALWNSYGGDRGQATDV